MFARSTMAGTLLRGQACGTEELKLKKTVKATEPLGTRAQGTSGNIGERPGPARRPKHLTIGAIKESEGIGLLEELTINAECNVVEDVFEDSTSIPGIHAEIQHDVPQRALTSRDSGNQPAACVKPPQVSDEPRLSRRGRRMSYTGCSCGCIKGSVVTKNELTQGVPFSSPGMVPATVRSTQGADDGRVEEFQGPSGLNGAGTECTDFAQDINVMTEASEDDESMLAASGEIEIAVAADTGAGAHCCNPRHVPNSVGVVSDQIRYFNGAGSDAFTHWGRASVRMHHEDGKHIGQ